MQRLFRKWFPPEARDADNADEMGKKPKNKPVDIDPDRGREILSLRERMDESQAEFGERFGVSQVTVSRWEQGMHPQRKHWNKLQPMLRSVADIKLSEIERNALPASRVVNIIEPDGIQRLSSESAIVNVPIEGQIGAGQWLDVQDIQAPVGFLKTVIDERFPVNARLRAFEVVGDSMDLEIPDGSRVIGVDYQTSPQPLQTGDWIVVEQIRDHGALIRRLIKEVHIFADHYELRSRSRNPAHKTINVPITGFDPHRPEDASEEIRILMIVEDAIISKHRRRRAF